ncbi:MAG: MFS transporter [Nitrospirota bacterium]|nr:MAG: MFS transporter [Nitrospirota bacterium]
MEKTVDSLYGWLIIILGGFTSIIAVGIPNMCMPVLFDEISRELGLNLVQIGFAWGMGGLASMITSPFGGMIGDRFGTKRTLFVGCLLAGMANACRGLSPNFAGLAVGMFLFGAVQNTMVVNLHKCSGIWFSGKRVVIANGIIATGIALGMMLGAMLSDSVMSPFLGGWRNVLFVYGAASVFIGCLWGLTKREPVEYEKAKSIDSPPFRQSLSRVLSIKEIWLIGVANCCYGGGLLGVVGYLPLYLRGIGWEPASADGALAAMSGAGMLAAIPLTLLSGKLGLRKGVIIPVLFIALISLILLPQFQGFLVWPLVILFGSARDGYYAILMTMVIEARGVGATYAGTAMGIILSLGNFGAFIASPSGNRLAVINPQYAFFFWAALLGISILIFRTVRETGRARAET